MFHTMATYYIIWWKIEILSIEGVDQTSHTNAIMVVIYSFCHEIGYH